jgi:hypothetical protein
VPATTSAPTAYPSWVNEMLGAINAPSDPVHQLAMYLWVQSEGGVPINNPLNISGSWDGSTGQCVSQCDGSSPIYTGRSLSQGIQANAAFVTANDPGIVAAFQNPNATLETIWQAIHSSTWCSGCSGGIYPSALYSALSGKGLSAANSATGLSTSALTGGAASCTPVIKFPGVAGVGSATLLDSCQAQEITGVLILLGGGILAFVGLALVAAAMGTGRLRGGPAKVAEGLVGGDIIGARRQRKKDDQRDARAAQAQSDRLEVIDARGQQTRRNQVKYTEEPF